MKRIWRRHFLALLGSLLAHGQTAALTGHSLWRPLQRALIKSSLLIRRWGSLHFLETPLSELNRSPVTSNQLFFLLNRRPVEISDGETAAWQVVVGGEVERPQRLALNDLRSGSRFPVVSRTAYLQCAGYGRAFFNPPVDDIPWELGAIGNAVWTGVLLKDVLEVAGLKPGAGHVAFAGKDGLPPLPDSYVKSIPLAKALDSGTLLAFEMNGAPLPALHGGPLRVIVPGWAGTYSVKWLALIALMPGPWDGYWMSRAFRVPRRPLAPGEPLDLSQTDPVTACAVNSIITQPGQGETLAAGTLTIQGFAWSGESEVVAVEVSTDNGVTWSEAGLEGLASPHAWRRWSLRWTPQPGPFVLRCRARDAAGQIQPLEQDNWNPGGYGWHAAQSVKVQVV